jgi:hypothetical protein
MHLITIHLVYHTHSFFIKTKQLMIYSVVMAAIGAFVKLWKSLLAFVMSVRMEDETHCHKIWYLNTFWKSA